MVMYKILGKWFYETISEEESKLTKALSIEKKDKKTLFLELFSLKTHICLLVLDGFCNETKRRGMKEEEKLYSHSVRYFIKNANNIIKEINAYQGESALTKIEQINHYLYSKGIKKDHVNDMRYIDTIVRYFIFRNAEIFHLYDESFEEETYDMIYFIVYESIITMITGAFDLFNELPLKIE